MTYAPAQAPGVIRIAPNFWQAAVTIDGKDQVLGTFPHQADAIRARQRALAHLSNIRRGNTPNAHARVKVAPCPFELPPPKPEPTHAARISTTAPAPMPRGVALHQTLKSIIAELHELDQQHGNGTGHPPLVDQHEVHV